MFLERSEVKTVIEQIEFPSDVKVRVFITGLSYCDLDEDESEISFLRHVDYHELGLIVQRRPRRQTGPIVEVVNVPQLDERYQSLVSLDDSIKPDQIKEEDEDVYPELEKMVNFHDLHDNDLDMINPVGKFAPSKLIIEECSFYTFDYFAEGCFEFREIDGTERIPREIGFILGGNIRHKYEESDLTIDYLGKNGEKPEGPFPGKIGNDEMLYDVIFINNCINQRKCEDDVSGLGNTDFAFYYQVLKEEGSKPGAQFILYKLASCLPVLHGFRSDLAACNPVIKTPKPGGYGGG